MTGVPDHRRMPGCLSDLDFSELITGDLEGQPREGILRHHLQQCAACAERLGARAKDPSLTPDPRVLRPVLASVSQEAGRGTRRRWAMGFTGTLGGAVVGGLILWGAHADPRTASVGERSKGTLALTIHVKRTSAGAAPVVEDLEGQGRLGVGEEIRFTVAAARPGFAVILGLDEAPSVTTYVPAPGSSLRATRVGAPDPVTLPGSVIADERLGFERIVAVVCPTEPSPEDLQGKARQALAKAGGHPEKVVTLGTGCPETSVLLRKTAR